MGDNEFSYLASALGETGFFTLVIKASFVMRGIITVGKLFITIEKQKGGEKRDPRLMGHCLLCYV